MHSQIVCRSRFFFEPIIYAFQRSGAGICTALTNYLLQLGFENSFNRANGHLYVPSAVSLDDVVDLVHCILTVPNEVFGVRLPSSEASLEISWIVSIMDLYILIAWEFSSSTWLGW
jgi:hypothetical protein